MQPETYRSYARVGLLTALSAVGALIKIPSPLGSIALDSAPGYFGALISLREGAIIAALGHLFSAYTGGFPLGVPMHLFIAVFMAFCAVIYGIISRKNIVAGAIIGTFVNGVVGSFIVLPLGGLAFVLTLMPFLVVASAVNIIVASAVYKTIMRP